MCDSHAKKLSVYLAHCKETETIIANERFSAKKCKRSSLFNLSSLACFFVGGFPVLFDKMGYVSA